MSTLLTIIPFTSWPTWYFFQSADGQFSLPSFTQPKLKKTPCWADEFVTTPSTLEPTTTFSTGIPSERLHPASGRFCRHCAIEASFSSACLDTASWMMAPPSCMRSFSGHFANNREDSVSGQPSARSGAQHFSRMFSATFACSGVGWNTTSPVFSLSSGWSHRCDSRMRVKKSPAVASASSVEPMRLTWLVTTPARIWRFCGLELPRRETVAALPGQSRPGTRRARRDSMLSSTPIHFEVSPVRRSFTQIVRMHSRRLSMFVSCTRAASSHRVKTSTTRDCSTGGWHFSRLRRLTLLQTSRRLAKEIRLDRSLRVCVSGLSLRTWGIALPAIRAPTRTSVSALMTSVTCEVLLFSASTAFCVIPGSMASLATTSGRKGRDQLGDSISWSSRRPAT
mmetsp:Transcript_50559/g.142439  ORF Transcript_50559/g.142439 Transcript_50559/m.142439 type:complete len:395 (+) Transcript_50559:1407-2591(+)